MVCVCLHALLATTAQPAKLAIYWKGENVATNGTAAAAVRSRGFTHAVVAHLDSAAALGAASLAPILLLGEQPYAPRAHSPYLDAAAFDASVATLRAALRNRTAALAGVAEDLELSTAGTRATSTSRRPKTFRQTSPPPTLRTGMRWRPPGSAPPSSATAKST